MLNIENLEVIEREELEGSYVINALSSSPNRTCSECNSVNTVIIGKVTQPYVDTPMHGKAVKIKYGRKRLRCKDCGKTSFEPLSWLSSDFRMSRRAEEYAIKRCGEVSSSRVASELNVTEGTIRNILTNYVTLIEARHEWLAPRVLGIDEAHFSKKSHLVMTDIEKRTLLDVRKGQTLETTKDAIMRLRGWQTIEIVKMGMCSPYRDAVKQLIPNAVIVVERSCFDDVASEAMKEARKAACIELTDRERKKLEGDQEILLKRRDRITSISDLASFEFWIDECPTLMEVYSAKERFLDMWDMPTRADAEGYWERWRIELTPIVRHYFEGAIKAIDEWHEEVFSWWDYPRTNVPEDSLNNFLKGAFPSGRGYSFEVLRAKLLYTKGVIEALPSELSKLRFEPTEMFLVDDPKIRLHGSLVSSMIDLLTNKQS